EPANNINHMIATGLSVKTLLLWICATIAQFYVCLPLYRSAWAAMKGWTANIDTLLVMSTTIAYFYSVGVTIAALSGSDFQGVMFGCLFLQCFVLCLSF